uniref:EOG090X0C5N n=1 Tax=Evadne anonyx TaxID=141404 RepID=A0A9N6WTB0_9CRUS|nr:EOG090X0C5N [Evadne anonyx]
MDFQNRAGGKTALETIDLNKDPYFMKNHLGKYISSSIINLFTHFFKTCCFPGTYECKLCLTLHNNEGSYLAHTQGKKHQSNLARRAAKDAKDSPIQPALEKARVDIRKFVKIGRPGYRVTKQRDPTSGHQSMLFQIDYPEIAEGVAPRHRFMSAYEQRIEPPDRRWQYLLFAAEPYETISFKIPSREVDKSEGKFWTHWNKDARQFFLQFSFKLDGRKPGLAPPPPPPGIPRPPANLPPGNLPPPPGVLGMAPPPPPRPMYNFMG